MASASVVSRIRRFSKNGGLLGLIRRVHAARTGPNRVKVGLPKGSSPYPDGTSVILVGMVHEFGSPEHGIPERPFLRGTLDRKRSELDQMAQVIAERVTQKGGTLEQGLNLLGAVVAGAIQETIADGVPPPLKPETIRRKGSSKTLIDTGHLRQSITWQVGRKK